MSCPICTHDSHAECAEEIQHRTRLAIIQWLRAVGADRFASEIAAGVADPDWSTLPESVAPEKP